MSAVLAELHALGMLEHDDFTCPRLPPQVRFACYVRSPNSLWITWTMIHHILHVHFWSRTTYDARNLGAAHKRSRNRRSRDTYTRRFMERQTKLFCRSYELQRITSDFLPVCQAIYITE